MDSLSHRERVLPALDRRAAGRVPMDLCGSTCNLVDALYFKVRKMLGIEGDIPPYRTGRTSSCYDERALGAFDTDFRHIAIKRPKGYRAEPAPDGTCVGEWGVRLRLYAGEVQCLSSPLEDAAGAGDALAHTRWPDTAGRSRVEGLRERVEYLRKRTDHAVSAKFVTSPGFLEHGGYLRGFQNFLCDLVADEDMADAVCKRIQQVKYDLCRMMLEEIDGDVDVVELSEDFGAQNAAWANEISPARTRKSSASNTGSDVVPAAMQSGASGFAATIGQSPRATYPPGERSSENRFMRGRYLQLSTGRSADEPYGSAIFRPCRAEA